MGKSSRRSLKSQIKGKSKSMIQLIVLMVLAYVAFLTISVLIGKARR